ncbi:MAG: 4Fe-4S binding protein [Anaerolineales bacterium]|nr:4Fe-4S binding protein [Anaerolineales bacterium]MCS7248356.1 4Fe-4S binding protein [Anaerolineales bacterium]MDW8162169.1 4Fe-4S binding protein [Anaerolineales bacterium]MDW8446724.1 4Fe-4S binding protein [Anaerolineales bacterium]
MPKTAVILDYQRCDPDQCEQGICRAAMLCKRKVINQEQPFEPPQLDPALCLGCAICITACPTKALGVLAP